MKLALAGEIESVESTLEGASGVAIMNRAVKTINARRNLHEPQEISSKMPSPSQVRAQLSSARADLDCELAVVGAIQRSLLPAELPAIPGFEVASHYQPCALAGGDYFDMVPLAENLWGLVIADVAGHGVSATVIMAVMRALVHAHLPHTRSMPPNGFLEFINRQMTSVYTPDGRFVTVWCAALDTVAYRLTYASAGHNPPRLVRRGTVLSLDGAGGVPLGIDAEAAYNQVDVPLEPGDLLMIYTDGITEAMRHERGVREFFGTERFDQVLIEAGTGSANECVTRMTSAVSAFSQTNVPTDDQTMLAIRVR